MKSTAYSDTLDQHSDNLDDADLVGNIQSVIVGCKAHVCLLLAVGSAVKCGPSQSHIRERHLLISLVSIGRSLSI